MTHKPCPSHPRMDRLNDSRCKSIGRACLPAQTRYREHGRSLSRANHLGCGRFRTCCRCGRHVRHPQRGNRSRWSAHSDMSRLRDNRGMPFQCACLAMDSLLYRDRSSYPSILSTYDSRRTRCPVTPYERHHRCDSRCRRQPPLEISCPMYDSRRIRPRDERQSVRSQ